MSASAQNHSSASASGGAPTNGSHHTNGANGANGGSSVAAANGVSASSSSSSVVSLSGDPLIEAVTEVVRAYMSRYDCSHDFGHIRRVVGLARYIAEEETKANQGSKKLDLRLITLCALLHDVGDRKYLDLIPAVDTSTLTGTGPQPTFSSDPASAAIQAVLYKCGAAEDMHHLVPLICKNVSWSHETKTAESAAAVADLVKQHPELAVVQDSDRLDSIGGIGIGRVFSYGAARGGGQNKGRTLDDSVVHFDEKLLIVETRMKTATGKRLARERTERLRIFKEWYAEEAAFAIDDPAASV